MARPSLSLRASGSHGHVSSHRHVKPYVRISRIRLSCWLPPTVCGPLESGVLSSVRSALKQSRLPYKACCNGLLHVFRPSEVLAVRYVPRRGSCMPTDAFISAPLPLRGLVDLPTVRRLRSTNVTFASRLLHARPPPSRLSAPFPVLPVIGPTLLRRFLAGARRLLQLLGVSLSSCHRYHPAEVDRSCQSDFDLPCCLHPEHEGSAFGTASRGHLCVHFRYGPTTRRLPQGNAVGRLHRLSFPLPCYPSYKALIVTLAGLSPAGHTSLSWTHVFPVHSPAPPSPLPSTT